MALIIHPYALIGYHDWTCGMEDTIVHNTYQLMVHSILTCSNTDLLIILGLFACNTVKARFLGTSRWPKNSLHSYPNIYTNQVLAFCLAPFTQKHTVLLYTSTMLWNTDLLCIYMNFIRAPLPSPSPCPSLGVFSLFPMDHLTVCTLWYSSRFFPLFSLPRNVLHCEGIEPHTFCFLSLIFDFVACGIV